MSSLQSRVEAAIRKVRGTTMERSYVHATPTDLSWPDVIALADEAERLRVALDKAVDAFHTHGKGVALSVCHDLEQARAASVLYDDNDPSPEAP